MTESWHLFSAKSLARSSFAAILEEALERTAVRVPGPPSRQPRYTARCPRGRAGTPACKWWTPECGVAGSGDDMAEQNRSAADAALRERITELSVHIPCGGLRGPLQKSSPYCRWAPPRWQSCRHEDNPEQWEKADISREFDLCVICFRATAGGPSRWAWTACGHCRAVNEAIEARDGFRPFALGRHSLMNGIGVRGGTTEAVRLAQEARLLAFAKGEPRLRAWKPKEYGRLASRFDPLADIPLRVWQEVWVPGKEASVDAFARVLGGLPNVDLSAI